MFSSLFLCRWDNEIFSPRSVCDLCPVIVFLCGCSWFYGTYPQLPQSLNYVLSSVRACPLCAFCPPPSSSCCFRLHREIHATLLPFLLFPVMFFFISLYGSVLAFFVTLLIVWFLFLSLKERGPCPGRQLGYSPVSLMPLRPGFKGAQRLSRTLTPGVAQSCC